MALGCLSTTFGSGTLPTINLWRVEECSEEKLLCFDLSVFYFIYLFFFPGLFAAVEDGC